MGEFLRIVPKLNFKKIRTIISVFVSFYISRWTKNTQHPSLPFSIAIEPTTSCNLRCPECPSGLRSFTRPTGMIDMTLYKKIIDEVHSSIPYLTFYFQGEPFLHPQFTDMVRYASDKKMFTSTSTNAHYLDEENARKTVQSGLDKIIISIDGTTQEVYEQYRVGGKLEKVIEGTKTLLRVRDALKSKSPYVIFQFLVVKPNEHQIGDIKILAKKLGVDEVRFKTAQIYDYKNGSSLMPENTIYSRYEKKHDGTFALKNDLKNHCWKMWHAAEITWDGKVVPCCFDKDAQYVMGTLHDTTFKKIWNSQPYHSFRAKLFSGRKEIDICTNCTEGTKVWT